jgi:hypothetical protein
MMKNYAALFRKGREIGYTHEQVRKMINKEELYQEVLTCESLEDIKILLLHWIEQGKIR